MRPDADPVLVGTDDLRRLQDEELVRRFASYRERGDRQRARAVWEQLVVNHFDRIRNLVAAWRHPTEANVRIAADDYDDVTQLALIRFLDKLAFRGETLGQLRAALRRLVDFTCRDFARKAMTREKGIAGSVDEPAGDEEGERGRFDADLADLAADEHAREEQKRDAHETVAAAMPRIPSRDQRAVLELSLDGVPAEDIATQLATSLDNVYQLRSRGLRKLKEVLADGQS